MPIPTQNPPISVMTETLPDGTKLKYLRQSEVKGHWSLDICLPGSDDFVRTELRSIHLLDDYRFRKYLQRCFHPRGPLAPKIPDAIWCTTMNRLLKEIREKNHPSLKKTVLKIAGSVPSIVRAEEKETI